MEPNKLTNRGVKRLLKKMPLTKEEKILKRIDRIEKLFIVFFSIALIGALYLLHLTLTYQTIGG